MGIKGNISSIPLADIIQLIGLGEKTGRLVLSDPNDKGYIYFEKGNIVYSFSENRKLTLEKINEDRKFIDNTKLKSIVETSKEKKSDPLELLVRGNLIKKEELDNHIKNYMLSIIYDFFKWENGDFEFEENAVLESPLILLKENFSNVIMEGSRRIDEIGLIKKILPNDRINFTFSSNAFEALSAMNITANEKKILLDLACISNIYRISKSSEFEEFDIYKIIFGFIKSKVIEIIQQGTYEVICEHVDLAKFFLERENFTEAKKEAERAFSLAPMDENIINLLNLCTKELKFEGVILNLFEIPLKLSKFVNYNKNTMDFINTALKKSEKIEKMIVEEKPKQEEKPKISPKDAILSGAQLLREEKFQEAIDVLTSIEPVAVTNYYLLLGNAYLKLNDVKNSFEAFSKCLEIDPSNEKIQKLVSALKTKIK